PHVPPPLPTRRSSDLPLLLKARISASLAKKHLHDVERRYLEQIEREKKRADDLLNVVIPIGAALSAERDFASLLSRILDEAMSLDRKSTRLNSSHVKI